MEEDYLTDKQFVQAISDHIKELLQYSNSLENSDFIELLEDDGRSCNEEMKLMGHLWRGADVQVVKCDRGSLLENWNKSVVNNGYHDDTPCPSRYPDLIVGLIRKLDLNAIYIDASNKYEFYFYIANRAQILEKRNQNFSKLSYCRDIIFNQTSLLNQWRRQVIENNKEEQTTLLDKGWVIYFAYGKNVNWNDMLNEQRCPDAIPMGNARLKRYKFIIDDRGVGSIKLDNNSNVIGCLWIVSPEDMKRLDLREGIARQIYRKETIKVESLMSFGPENEVLSVTYISNSPEGNLARDGYIEGIVDGLSHAGFEPKEYLHYLNYIPNNKNLKVSEDITNENLSVIKKEFLPEDLNLPFFAYGIFKKGQISFFRIKDFVKDIKQTHIENAFLAERDGIPLLGVKKENEILEGDFANIYADNRVYGDLISFKKVNLKEAYLSIANIEPEKQYLWGTVKIGNVKVNTLIGRRVFKGSIPMHEQSWDMSFHDPFIGGVIKFKEDVLASEDRRENFIELQAVYLMLWTAIERICTLKFSLASKSEGLEKQLIENLQDDKKVYDFLTTISKKPESFRTIYRSDNTEKKFIFEKGNFIKCIKYLRQIRNNVAHRGKGGFADESLTLDAIEIVFKIFEKLKTV